MSEQTPGTVPAEPDPLEEMRRFVDALVERSDPDRGTRRDHTEEEESNR